MVNISNSRNDLRDGIRVERGIKAMTIGSIPLHITGGVGYVRCKATAIIAGSLDMEKYRFDPVTLECTCLAHGKRVRVDPLIRTDHSGGYWWDGGYVVND